MKLFKLLTLIFSGLIAISCIEKNLFDPVKAEQLLKEKYEISFVEKFGEVPTNFSWDRSNSNRTWKSTRYSNPIDFTVNDFMIVDDDVISYMNKELKEQVNNKDKGKSFVMAVPNNEFTIVPIYQGNAGSTYELYITMGSDSVKIWSKGDGSLETLTQYSSKTDNVWKVDGEFWEPVKIDGRTDNKPVTYFDENGNIVTSSDRRMIQNVKVRGKQITINPSGHVGDIMTFRVKITKGGSGYSNTGDIQSSDEGYMVSLYDCPQPSQLLEDDNEVMIIGCEVANEKNGNKSDWDMNDLVFLVYGNPHVPDVIEIKNKTVENILSKRYMFEDLGTTDDFDFNDLVIDLFDINVVHLEFRNEVLIDSIVSHRQEAIVRNLGGTIPFKFKVGDNLFYESGTASTFNTTPNDTIFITGWIPDENNVSLIVNNTVDKELLEYNIPFPEIGCKAPMVIATNTNVNWKPERESITIDWFNSLK